MDRSRRFRSVSRGGAWTVTRSAINDTPAFCQPHLSNVQVMALSAGDTAPDFELTDDAGGRRSLAGLLGSGPVVLFFYPAAMTSGCTAESCHFRDLGAEFAKVGAQRVGISADPVDKQRQFAETNSFDYPLLSDPDGAVATAYGVKRRFPASLPVKRVTFVIGADGVIKDVIKSEFKMVVHADKALAALGA